MKFWPHAFITFTVNTNFRRRNWTLKRNSTPLRVFGHRGTWVVPREQRDKVEKSTTKVMFLSYVLESAGAVWILLPDNKVVDALDRA